MMTHFKTCSQLTLHCPHNECTMNSKFCSLQELIFHLEHQCQWTMFACNYCNLDVERIYIDEGTPHQFTECSGLLKTKNKNAQIKQS